LVEDAGSDSTIVLLPANVLAAMLGLHRGDLADVVLWIDNRVMLPPRCIKGVFQLEERIEANTTPAKGGQSLLQLSLGGVFDEQLEHAEPVRMVSPKDCAAFLSAMKSARLVCKKHSLVPLFHYTAPPVGSQILDRGLAMSNRQSDGGVYFSTRGPASYGLGSPDYETNIILDCFGKERLEEYRGKHRLDVCVVYGIDPSMMQAPGGSDNAKMVSRQSFEDFSLPHADGNYFLRPDRILAAFLLDPARPTTQERKIRFKSSEVSEFTRTSQALGEREEERDGRK